MQTHGIQNTRKVDSLSNIKDNVKHFSSAIYEVKYSSGSNYVLAETNGTEFQMEET